MFHIATSSIVLKLKPPDIYNIKHTDPLFDNKPLGIELQIVEFHEYKGIVCIDFVDRNQDCFMFPSISRTAIIHLQTGHRC